MMPTTWTPIVYALVMATAAVTCSVLLRRSQRALPLPATTKWLLGLSGFVGAMLGAKLPFVLADERGVLSEAWFAHGKTILAGLVGGYLAVEGAKFLLDVRTRLGDSYAIPVAVAVAIGRLGCFVGGCCFGTETDQSWGVGFPLAPDGGTVLRHPTQLYEAAFHAVMVVVLIGLRVRGWLTGQHLKVYILAYLGYRFVTEFIRPEATVFAGLTAYQWAAFALVPVFVLLWWKDARPMPPAGRRSASSQRTPATGISRADDAAAATGPSSSDSPSAAGPSATRPFTNGLSATIGDQADRPSAGGPSARGGDGAMEDSTFDPGPR